MKVMHLSRAFQRQFSSSKFSHTSVFMQSGLKIRELPLVVKKVNDVLSLDEASKISHVAPPSVPIVFVDKTMSDLMENMNRFVSVDSLFKFLETIPAGKVTPPVAVHALKRIIHLNNLNNQIKSDGSFLRFAFINMLLDIVYRSKDPRCILDGLRVVCQDDFSEERQQIAQYKERMYEETVMLMTDGLFSITQICEAVVILSRFYANDRARSQELADSLWTGIVDKAENSKNNEELDIKTAIHMFKILPYLTKSRDMIYKMVSSKVCDEWKRLCTKDVLEILRIVNSLGRVQCNRCQHSTLSMISQWLSVNIHTLSEAELLAVIVCMDKMEFLDNKLIQTTERFMKAKGLQVKEADLIAAICDLCDHQRLRSRPILEASCEYLLENALQLNLPQINSISKVFGNLNLHPSNAFKFWEKVESLIESKHHEFPPKDLISLLLSFVYIEKFPVNMMTKLINPNFYDRMDYFAKQNVKFLMSELDILVAAMKIEKSYIQKSSFASYFNFDQRVFHLSRDLLDPLASIVGDVKRIGLQEFVPGAANNSFYSADMMVFPSVAASLSKFGRSTYAQNSRCMVVLINTPDHFDRSGQYLLGRQAMRIRHFKKMGFKVMNIRYTKVQQLKMMPHQVKNYLQKEYDNALQHD